MEFHQIRYFLAACDQMNFTRAAEACAVSQPSLTVAIQKLEAELGAPLFLREGRQVRLTNLGRAMRTHLGRVDETRAAARDVARTIVDRGMEQIDLGVMCTIGPARIGRALGIWQREAEGVEIVLHDVWGAKARELLLSGAIDCALIARRAPLSDRFDAAMLVTESVELAMVPGHPLAAQGLIALAEVSRTPYIDRLHCEFRQEFFDLMAERDLMLDVVLRSEREDWMQHAVARGDGVSMLPVHSIVVEGIVTRPLAGLSIQRHVEIVTVRGRPQRRIVQRFVDFLATTGLGND